MKNLTVLILLHLLFLKNEMGIAQQELVPILDRYYQKSFAATSKSYSILYKHKTFSSEDTLLYWAHVDLIRDPRDTIFGGKVLIDRDTLLSGYNGEYIFNAELKSSVITFADPVLYPEAFIKGNVLKGVVDDAFLQMDSSFKTFILDPSIHLTWGDTVINGLACTGINIYLPDQEEFVNQHYFLALGKQNEGPVSKVFRVEFQGNVQYSEWNYSHVVFAQHHQADKLKPEFLNSFKTIYHYSSDPDSKDTEVQFDYTALTGTILLKEEKLKLADLQSRFIILDFWYTSCYPCIKCIPSVNRIYDAFRDKGVRVFGVNPIDNPATQKARLEKFLLHNPMSYPTLMLDASLKEDFPIRAYPTLIILDHQGQVIYNESGCSQTMFEEVSAFLNSRL